MTRLEIVLSAVAGIGGIGGIAALFKIRPEVARTTVSAAEGAVIVQAGVIESLRAEIQRLAEALAQERRECAERDQRRDAEVAALRMAFEKIDERKKERREGRIDD